jgi:hypothetical protein
MHGILYEDNFVNFLIVTVILGGAAAWMTGRACALTWRPYATLLLYLVILAAAVRFIHFAPLEGTLLSVHYYLVDFAVVLIIGFLGYRHTRMKQMTSRYAWLFKQAGPLAWKNNE